MTPIGIYDIAGLIGTALVIVAYFATQVGSLDARDWRYPLANLVGAMLILLSLFSAWNFPAFVMEIFWLAISLYGLARALGRRA